MLPDSMNVGVIAENIKKLEAMVQEAGSELPTPEAGDAGKVLTVNNDLGYSIAAVPHEVPTPGEGDTDKIIKVGSNGYELAVDSYNIPYLTTEYLTGRKWIDGRDIYETVLSGNFPTISETGPQTVTGLASDLNIVKIDGMCVRSNGNATNLEHFSIVYQTIGNILINDVSSGYSEGLYNLIVEYCKPAPAPSNETKKSTTKKK